MKIFKAVLSFIGLWLSISLVFAFTIFTIVTIFALSLKLVFAIIY